jgi:TonB-linked SusC/RagA family outer membrane protein
MPNESKQKAITQIIVCRNNLFLFMKIFSPILLITSLQFSVMAKGQTKLTLTIKNTTLPAAIQLVEDNSDYNFVYNNDVLPEDKTVNAEFVDADIVQVMNTLLQGTTLSYTLTETDLIVLFKKDVLSQADHPISGKVTDEKGNPLPGASIQIKGTGNGTSTNSSGEFSLTVPDSAILVISYVGYETKEVAVGDQTTLSISLTPAATKVGEEVIVVGYGTQRKIDVTGSVSHVTGAELVKQPVLTATQAIQGKVAGVQIISSGQPGSSPQVVIRGAGSILGGANPLYVVDGIALPPGDDITNINTADILSIDVLKDASSAAIYGARASNGVILITTRQGSGKMKVNYSVNVGINQAAYVVPMANSTQYINYVEAITGLPVSPTGYSTNWYNQILRNAFYQDHNVSVSGGNDKNKYLFNASYLDDDGIIIASNFQRYTVRFNNEFTPNTAIKIGTTMSFANGSALNVPLATTAPTANPIIINPFIASVTEDAYRDAPTVPAIVNGKYGNTSQYQNVGNAVLDAYNANDMSNTNKIQGNAYIEIKPIKSISIKSSFGGELNFFDETKYTYEHPNDSTFFNVNGGSQGASRSELDITNIKFYDWSWDNTINYNKTFGRSKVNVLAGTTAEKYYSTGFTGTRYNVPPIPSEWYLQSGDPNTAPPPNSAALNDITRVSYIGRLFYSYDDRFLFTGTFRADASSVFAANNQWGYFPGVSGGWVITKEKFMNNQHVFDYLKLRAGWGELGNSNIQSDASFKTAYYGVGYFFNSGNRAMSGVTGSIIPQVKVLNLKWEITKESDIGLEYSILKGKLTGELDVYDKKVNNALIPVYANGTLGNTGSPASNINENYIIDNAADIDNKGLEFSARWHDNISKNLSYSIGGNVSFNRNRVVSLNGGSPYFDENINGTFVTETKAGYPIGSFFVNQVIGVFQNQAQIDNYKDKEGKQLQPGAQPGDFIYKYNDSTLDTAYAGSYQPVAYLGLSGTINYKNWDFSVDVYSTIGNQVYNGKEQERVSATDNIEASVATSFWTPQNGSETQPRANAGNLPASTYFISSGSFVRINNITFGYSLPLKLLNKQKAISSCRIFINTQNPFTFKKYNGFTSELPGGPTNSGVELSTYPTVRTFAVGANLGF